MENGRNTDEVIEKDYLDLIVASRMAEKEAIIQGSLQRSRRGFPDNIQNVHADMLRDLAEWRKGCNFEPEALSLQRLESRIIKEN
ncbi:hypothetical protein ACFL2V_15170 [Pseudomonadota bacterium]